MGVRANKKITIASKKGMTLEKNEYSETCVKKPPLRLSLLIGEESLLIGEER